MLFMTTRNNLVCNNIQLDRGLLIYPRGLPLVLVRRSVLVELRDQYRSSSRWADVETTKNSEIYVSQSGCSHGPPTVQYRGIFLNDEQPALQNWAMEKFTNGTTSSPFNSPFNHFFYAKV
jgi:hypothetical protein